MRIAAVVLSAFRHPAMPTATDSMGQMRSSGVARIPGDCETIGSVITAACSSATPSPLWWTRYAMDGYMAQLIAECATGRAKAAVAAEQSLPWLAEMNKTRNSRRAPRTVCSIATTSSRGTRNLGRRATCPTVWRGMARKSVGRFEPGSTNSVNLDFDHVNGRQR